MEKRVLSILEVAVRYGIHKSTIERMVKRGEFVRKVATSPRRRAFPADEVEAWFEARRAQAGSQS